MLPKPFKYGRTERCLFAILFFRIVRLSTSVLFSDQFVIQMDGGPEAAKQFAEDHGFSFLGQIFDDHYHMMHERIAKRSIQASDSHHRLLSEDPRVKSFSLQIIKRRSKRDVSSVATHLNDPKWPEMWYLNRGRGLDMNVQAAWQAGSTGKDTVVTILDDGLEKDHPDIIQNYDPNASSDINGRDADPEPRYDFLDSNRHGTRCAGEVAASANNSLCSVGIAYEARVGGIRMLDGDVTDAVEARSLSFNPQHIDIYSVSWGPDDDGKTVDGPGELATRAFVEGIEKGRGGLGSIFVWASGNGGRERDNCNCDGYTNAIWTLSISSATENGLVPWYSEACSSTLATTYSSGSSGEKQIVTTDLHHGCTSSHTGTSASAPLAAGICALTLEVNKQLSWRDMQHVVVRTANPANLLARDWVTNGVGRNVSHSFGYGMMDAGAMVKLARSWKTVPPQKMCEIRAHHMDKPIPAKNKVELSLDVHCENVRYLEHVQAKITLSATRRGDMDIYLTSPLGTKSTLLAQRPADHQRSGFQAWPFMTVHCWGENPNGVWKLEVHNEGRYSGHASLKDWSLILYGTSENPDDFLSGRDSFKPSDSTSKPSLPLDEKLNEIIHPSDTSFEDNYVAESAFVPKTDGLRGPKKKEYLSPGGHTANESGKKSAPSSKQRNGCVLMDPAGICLDCLPNLHLVDGQCLSNCPEGHFLLFNSTQNEQCVRCHYSCHRCSGPNDYQCTTCYGDSQLEDHMYCRPIELMMKLQSFAAKDTAMIVAFLVLFVIVICMAGTVIVSRHPGICSCCRNNNTYGYHLATQPRMTMSVEEKGISYHRDSNSDED